VIAALAAGGLWLARGGGAATAQMRLPAGNPLQLGAAVTFAVLFVVLAFASSWVSMHFGREGVYALSFITGLTDIDPFVLSLAQGGALVLTLRGLAAAVLLAASSNNMLKAVYALAFGGLGRCRRPALVLLGLALVGFALAAMVLR
jgi:uncharacterized membrane protein (DUF4010 family)